MIPSDRTSEMALGPTELALERLAAEGVVTMGLPQDSKAYRRPRIRLAGSSQELLDADRAER